MVSVRARLFAEARDLPLQEASNMIASAARDKQQMEIAATSLLWMSIPYHVFDDCCRSKKVRMHEMAR